MVAQKPELLADIEKLDYYIDLYQKSNPNWNKQPEEVKVEEPVEVFNKDSVLQAFKMFA